MSVNVQRYKASSNRLVGYLVPFFIRGKRVLQFMSAICSPMDDVNDNFMSWASDMLTEAAATSQPIVLKWLLNEKLRRYFENSNSSFQLQYRDSDEMYVYEDQDELSQHNDIQDVYLLEDTTDDALTGTDNKVQLEIYNYGSQEVITNNFIIVAPAHNSLIGDNNYQRQIDYWINKYLVNTNVEYSIVISN